MSGGSCFHVLSSPQSNFWHSCTLHSLLINKANTYTVGLGCLGKDSTTGPPFPGTCNNVQINCHFMLEASQECLSPGTRLTCFFQPGTFNSKEIIANCYVYLTAAHLHHSHSTHTASAIRLQCLFSIKEEQVGFMAWFSSICAVNRQLGEIQECHVIWKPKDVERLSFQLESRWVVLILSSKCIFDILACSAHLWLTLEAD